MNILAMWTDVAWCILILVASFVVLCHTKVYLVGQNDPILNGGVHFLASEYIGGLFGLNVESTQNSLVGFCLNHVQSPQ